MSARPDFHRPTWANFSDANIFWPVVVLLVLTVALFLLSFVYVWAWTARGFRRFIGKYIGRVEKPSVEQPFFIVVLAFLCFILSVVETIDSIQTTYTLGEVRPRWFQVAIALFFTTNYCVMRLQAGLRPLSAWGINALVDLFTVVPVLMPFGPDLEPLTRSQCWLTLKYLRIYSAMKSYQAIMDTTTLGELSEVTLFFLGWLMRTATLIVMMGGTIFVLEVLGELPGYADHAIPVSDGAEVSVFQAAYWTVTTISTVGYGDFAPHTIPSRLTVAVFIFIGCGFFGNQISGLASIRSFVDAGMGNYLGDGQHMILAGPGASTMSTMLQTVLLESLDSEKGVMIPDIVFLSDTPYDPDLLKFVQTSLPINVQSKITFLRGNVMSTGALNRAGCAKCRFIFVLPNLSLTGSGKEEDSRNILRTLEIGRCFPKARSRLMLLEEESENHAISLGVLRERCFNVRGLTAHLMAVSLRIKGFATMLAGLLQFTSTTEMAAAFGSDYDDGDGWCSQYCQSTARQVYGFAIGEKLLGLEFGDAAAKIYGETNGSVLLIAAQVYGKLRFSWSGVLQKHQVVVCIGQQYLDCKKYADTACDWTDIFIHNRDKHKGSESALDDQEGPQASTSMQNLRQRTLDEEAYAEDIDSLDDFWASSNLVILILIDDTAEASWTSTALMLQRLRDPYLSGCPPVIVVANNEPPQEVADKWGPKRVAFIAGPVLQAATLHAAGVEKAESVAVISAGATGLADHQVVTISALLDRLQKKNKHPSRLTMYEFGSTDAACLIQGSAEAMEAARFSSARRLKSRQSFSETARAWTKPSTWGLTWYIKNFILVTLNVLREVFFQARSASTMGYASALTQQLLLQPKFAAGEVFTPDFFGAMLGHIFNFPATIEFVEALVQPVSHHQNVVAWQVLCPAKWVDRPLRELVLSWLKGEDPLLAGMGTVCVLSLFREDPDQAERTCFNSTLPDGSTVLCETDLITVLASTHLGGRLEKDKRGRNVLTSAEDPREPQLTL